MPRDPIGVVVVPTILLRCPKCSNEARVQPARVEGRSLNCTACLLDRQEIVPMIVVAEPEAGGAKVRE